MLEFDFTFPHEYEVEQVREWPGTGSFSAPVIYFPPPKTRDEHDGLWFESKDEECQDLDRCFCIRLHVTARLFSCHQLTQPRKRLRRFRRKCVPCEY